MEEFGGQEKNYIVKIDYDLQALIDASSGSCEWEKRSIYKLPSCITDLNPKAYEPQAVSIGPYHNGKVHLLAMEEPKHRALAHFLKRTKKLLQELLKPLSEKIQNLRNSYHPLDSKWRDDDKSFLQMVVLDGCFVLEILLKNGGDEEGGLYDANDPIFSNHGKIQIMPYIKRDMLMLENQLPMLVLDKLFSFLPRDHSKKDRESVIELPNDSGTDTESVIELPNDSGTCRVESVIKLIQKFWPSGSGTDTPKPITKSCLHILDVVRETHIEKIPEKKEENDKKKKKDVCDGNGKIIRSATELNEAGIIFKQSRTGSFTNVSFDTFCCSGVLSLPVIVVDDATESKLLNMLAFERLHVGAGNEVTSYVFLMDNIIENERDVALLHDSEVIQNAMGSAKAAADLFNSLSKDTTLDPSSSLSGVHRDVQVFCGKRMNKYRASLWRNYFTSPWAIISLVAAILLFVLTMFQTYHTIYPYYNPRETTPDEASPRFLPLRH